jgi:hypothetical protein
VAVAAVRARRPPFQFLAEVWRGGKWLLRDSMSQANYERDGDNLAAQGLYLDAPAWKGQVFEATRR